MGKSRQFKFFWLAFLLVLPPDWSTVYSATELFLNTLDDRIHTKIDSAYNLKNYGDIFKLLDQEDRIRVLKKKEAALENLRTKLDTLMAKDDEDIDIEKRILKSEKDCIRAGELYRKLNLFESVVLSLEAKGFRTRDFIRVSRGKAKAGEYSFPECSLPVKDDSTSEFIIQTRGFQNRRKLVASAEYDMDPEVTSGLSVIDYGGAVAEALKTNSTSWILLNMATFYYRMVGNAPAGLECSRRALHFSPREHKDIILTSIASFLFRGDYPDDALMVLRTAVDISGGSTPVYSLMGFILASTSEFDAAVEAFASALRVSKEEKKLNEYRYAVRCHAKVHRALSKQHQDLREIIRQFDQIGVHTRRIDAIWAAVHATRENSVQVLLQAYGRKVAPSSHSFRPDGSYDFPFLTEDVRKPLTWFGSETLHFSTHAEKFSKFFPSVEYEFLASTWPTTEDCDLRLTRDIASYRPISVFIPWENKGFEFWSVVSQLRVTDDFPLPYCESIPFKLPTTTSEMFAPLEGSNFTTRYPDLDMRRAISQYMDVCGSIDEFGRKVMLAQILNLMPLWMFFDMAAVYWRATGAVRHVAECYGRAFHSVPEEYKDVVQVGMASFFRFMNMSEPSLFVMGEIAESTPKEPAALYTMGTILGFHGFLSLSVRNYKLALVQDVSFYPAFAAFKNARCMQLILGPGHQNWGPEVERFESLKAGVIEIGIGILELDDPDSSVHILKRSVDNVIREDFLDSRYSERLKIAFSDLKKGSNRKIKP